MLLPELCNLTSLGAYFSHISYAQQPVQITQSRKVQTFALFASIRHIGPTFCLCIRCRSSKDTIMPPLITLEVNSRAPYERLPSDARATSASDDDDSVLDIDNGEENGQSKRVKKWWNYIPLCCKCHRSIELLTMYLIK